MGDSAQSRAVASALGLTVSDFTARDDADTMRYSDAWFMWANSAFDDEASWQKYLELWERGSQKWRALVEERKSPTTSS